MTKGRWLLVAVALAGQSLLAAWQTATPRPIQSDDVPRVLAELSTALSSGEVGKFRALAAMSLPPADASIIEQEFRSGVTQRATVRERARVPDQDGIDVLADVFFGRGRQAKIATWRITLRPKTGAAQPYVIAALQEQAAFDGLIKLTFDDTRQFAVRGLTVHSTDMTLKMASGTAFVAESAGGITALVLRGSGELEFAPPDPAEQAQLRVVAGHPTLRASVDSAFIRVNPAEFAKHISGFVWNPTAVDALELARAREVFARMAPQSFNVDLHDIGEQGWSLTPGPENIVVELKAKTLGWLTYARAPNEPEDITLVSRTAGHVLSSYASPERLAERGRVYDEDASMPYDIERYGLDVTFDPARFQISGRTSLLVKIKGEHASSLSFRLDDALTVTSVSTPGFGRLLAMRVVGQDKVLVSLPGSLPRGAELLVDFVYNGRLAPPPLDREALMPAVDVARPQGPQGSQAPPPEIFQPNPEPLLIYSGRLAWYPQSFVSDYASATMRLVVPAEFAVAASGSLVRSSISNVEDTTKPGGTRSLRSVEFSATRPVRYLGCVIGRLVPAGNYHEQWLSEGLAQYFAVLYTGSSLGDATMRKVLGTMRTSALAVAARGPISLGYRLGHIENDGRTFRTIVYNKSAVVLHMLRGLIGDDAFFAGLRRYYRDHRFQKAGTDDLRTAFEAETPIRLQRFFDRWILTPDLPRLKVTSRVETGGMAALIHVEQMGPVFDLPLTFAVEYADGHIEEITVPVTEAVIDRRIPLRSKARRVFLRDELTLANFLN